jgi:FkbM family methyltransferase
LSIASGLRRIAQSVRHHPSLAFMQPAWPLLRKPYLAALNLLGGRSGIEVRIAGCGLRLSPRFSTQNWETVEAASYRAFVDSVKPGAIVYDVGAHIGTYSILALMQSGPTGRVVAYEPCEFTRKYLERHLAWNAGVDRTVIRDVCCGAAPGTAEFFFAPDEAEGMNGLVPVAGFSRMAMRVTTLDAEVEALGLVPDIIKIDVEGAEWDVLRGAEKTLATCRPTLFLSVHPDALSRQGLAAADIEAWLKERGYGWTVIARDHEVHVIASPAERSRS